MNVKEGKITHFSLHSPEKALPGVHDKKTLETALHYYGGQMGHTHVPDSKNAQRYHIQKVRPALRWFCKRYGVPVPEWLKGNGVYDNMTDAERKKHYGREEMNTTDFEDMDAPPPAEDGK